MRRVVVPWPLLALLGLAVVVLTVQGLRMAADRTARLLPIPVVGTFRLPCEGNIDPKTTVLAPTSPHSALLLERSCAARLGLIQEFAERDLLRWMEPTPSRSALTLPLEGLETGVYRIVTVPDDGAETPREMDAPNEEWPTLARFEVTDAKPRPGSP